MTHKCSVLVPDDNRDAADAFVGLLEALGHAARAAYDSAQAYHAFFDFQPDVAILDVQMPHMDGCVAAARMRAHESPPKLIAFRTGMRHGLEPMKSLAGVFDRHLAKPCDMAELHDFLERADAAGRH